MALINCRECSSQVSDTALDCPSCGISLNKPKRSFIGGVFKWWFVLFNIFMVVVTLKACGGFPDTYSSSQNEYAQADAAIRMGLLLTLWVFVDIILGMFVLFTRPKR